MSDVKERKKPRILLCWGYHRKGWVQSFNALKDDFDFYYLFYLTKPENEINYSESAHLLYLKDYSSAQDIIEKIKPDKIVMMGTDGMHTVALNIVAKKKNIETLVLQHGRYSTYYEFLCFVLKEKEEREKTGRFERSETEVDRFFLLGFYLRSVALISPLAIFYMLKIQYLKRKYTELEAQEKTPSEFRVPSAYIVLTKKGASFYAVKDKIGEDQMIEIGNPEMDDFFNYQPNGESETEHYYLLIEQPLSAVKDFASPGFGISEEKVNEFYQKLAEYADSKQARLKIKLHPYSYRNDFLLQHPNIDYIRDADIVKLLMDSKGVFGIDSTLTLPAVYFKNCCLFKVWEELTYQDELENLGLAQILDFHSFEIEDINLESIHKTAKSLEIFVREQFYKTDGKSIERLKKVLKEKL